MNMSELFVYVLARLWVGRWVI